MKAQTVTAIVPFYNEEKSIGQVIATLLSSPFITEIICVNDGSKDGSSEVLKKFKKKITVIEFKTNHGKGRAVAEGIKKAKGDYLLFCDADLINFTPEHIKKMLTPVLSGETPVSFAVPTQDKTGKYSRHEVFLAGERVYPRRELLPHLKRISGSKGAGASEIFLNTLFKKKDLTVVPLIGLVKPSKEQKWSSPIAFRQYLFSLIGILAETGKIEINSVSDLKQLENLIQVDTFENLIGRIREIKDKKIRAMLEKYYSKYLAKYVNKIKPPFLTV